MTSQSRDLYVKGYIAGRTTHSQSLFSLALIISEKEGAAESAPRGLNRVND